MGCLFYNSPFVQYRWCLAGVSPAPCPFNRTVLHALNLNSHCFPWTNIHSNGTMHYIIGSDLPILFLPPIASDCHFHIQYISQRTLEQEDSIILLVLDSAMSYIPISIVFCISCTSQSPFLDRQMWMVSGRTIETDEGTKHQPPPSPFTSHYLVICHPNSSAQQVSSWVVHWMDSIQWYLEQSPATSLLCLAYLNVCLSECVKVAIYLRLTYSIIRITNPYSKKKK
eukprot:963225_1